MKKTIAQKYPLLGSSQNPNEISMRIKAGGLMIIPLLIAIARMFGMDLVESDLVLLLNSVAFIISYSFFLYGTIRAKLK